MTPTRTSPAVEITHAMHRRLPAPRQGESQMIERHGVRYRRDAADQSLETLVRRSLEETGRQQLAGLQVSAQTGVVTLYGEVPSYFAMQLAHQAVLSVAGVQRLECCLRVVRSGVSRIAILIPRS